MNAAVVGNAIAVTAHIRHAMPALQRELHVSVVASSRDARTTGREALEREIGVPFRLDQHSGVEDEAAAAVASSSLSSAWGAAALAALASAEAPDDIARSIAGISKAIDYRTSRVAATETARAFNAEREAALDALTEASLPLSAIPTSLRLPDEQHEIGNVADRALHPEHEPPHVTPPPAAGLFKIWSAILDRGTCERCFRLDGMIVERDKSFPGGSPPIHPNCRCIVEFIIISRPERLEDIAFDYDLFKQEVRDVIRERRGFATSPALAFISDSLGEGRRRSPLALTRRFARLGEGAGGGGGGGGTGGSSGSGGGEEHPAHRRLGVSRDLVPTRDRPKESRAHLAGGREARRELRKGRPAFVFSKDTDLDALEAHVWEHGTVQPDARGWSRLTATTPQPVGVRLHSTDPPRPLDVVEIKGRIEGSKWTYHLVPREKPARERLPK